MQVQELRKRLSQNRQALFSAGMKHKMQRLSNMMELKNFRRDIARLETALSVLPKSALVSHKKNRSDSPELKRKKAVKTEAVRTKATPSGKPKDPATDVSAKEEAQRSFAKKQMKAKSAIPEKSSVGKKTPVKESIKENQSKKKKWFDFFSSGQKPSGSGKSSRKRNFFRRKSG